MRVIALPFTLASPLFTKLAAILATSLLVVCLLTTQYAAALEADPVERIMDVSDLYARELMASPPDDLTRGEIALAFGWIYLFDMLGRGDRVRAENYLVTALDNGTTEAGVVLGAMHLGGEEYGGGARDLPKALDYYETAAAAGSVDALRMLGVLYSEGSDDLPSDPARGREYLLQAAARGSVTARELLRPVLAADPEWRERMAAPEAAEEALDSLVDPELATQTLERSDRIGAATAKVFELLERHLALLEIGARAGSAANADRDGLVPGASPLWEEMERNIDDWTREIIDSQPNPKARGEAALMVGIFHYMGLLAGVDAGRAEENMRLAQELGVPEARVTLGELYLGFAADEDKAPARDVHQALAHLTAAAREDHVDALRLLGLVYAEGAEGIEPDPEKAETYFLAAARHGDAEALARLAPVFARAAEWNRAHPEAKSPLPASPEEAVDPVRAEAAAKRSEELGRVAAMLQAELDRRTRELLTRDKE